MFEELETINTRPKPFEFYTANDLWTDEYTSKQMLSFHLNEDIDVSSRNAPFIDRSVEWIASHFDVGAGVKIADFGCGPGLYTTRLAKKQADVTGIDFSKGSIQYAQEVAIREGLPIHYVNQNYLEFETDDRFQLVLMIMCDFCALSPTQRKMILNKFYTFLEPGGFVLLDVYSLEAYEQRKETTMYEADLLNGFWSPNKYYGFLNTFKYEREKVVLDKYTLIEANRIRTVYNWLQYFSPEELKREFMECGFIVEGLYSDVAGSPFASETKEFAVVARKIKKMTPKPLTIGFKEEWKVFFDNHPLWPEKCKLLTSTLTKIFIRKVITSSPADRVVFHLGRLCVEDFNEIFLLCGNGYGIGGLKILRGLYERVVTLGYISDNPNQAEPFLQYDHIHRNKMRIHAEKIFDLEKCIGAKELLSIKENYKIYKDKFQEIACKKCKTKRTMLSWSKLDTASMAKKIGLDELYFAGFFYPTLQTHATLRSLDARMKDRENENRSFDEGAQHEWANTCLITAHNLMIYVLMIQNTYFELNIDSEIEERKNDFQEMWGDAEQH